MSLYVQETGENRFPTIVFLHGMITGGWMWQQQTQRLQDFHCLVPDLPEHGRSHHIPWKSIEDTTRQVADLIYQRAPSGRANLVGLSLGSVIALQVMQTNPELVGRVILSGTNVLTLPPRMRFTNLIFLPFIKTGHFMRLACSSLRLSPEAAALYSESLRRISYLTLRRITQQSANFRVNGHSKFSNAAALIVAGQEEHTLVLRSMKLLLAVLPHSCGYLVPGGRHGWVGEAPDVFAQMLGAWFSHGQMPPELMPVESRAGFLSAG
jgi:pimeloyl-ACP methyl ester carboxylesterase